MVEWMSIFTHILSFGNLAFGRRYWLWILRKTQRKIHKEISFKAINLSSLLSKSQYWFIAGFEKRFFFHDVSFLKFFCFVSFLHPWFFFSFRFWFFFVFSVSFLFQTLLFFCSSHVAELSSQPVESSSHLAEFRSHLAESSSDLIVF
jgi:hypothetical protein